MERKRTKFGKRVRVLLSSSNSTRRSEKKFKAPNVNLFDDDRVKGGNVTIDDDVEDADDNNEDDDDGIDDDQQSGIVAQLTLQETILMGVIVLLAGSLFTSMAFHCLRCFSLGERVAQLKETVVNSCCNVKKVSGVYDDHLLDAVCHVMDDIYSEGGVEPAQLKDELRRRVRGKPSRARSASVQTVSTVTSTTTPAPPSSSTTAPPSSSTTAPPPPPPTTTIPPPPPPSTTAAAAAATSYSPPSPSPASTSAVGGGRGGRRSRSVSVSH